jgi:two-component system CheB/CheR fusion protein
MHLHQIDKIAAYVRYLRENSQEVDLLFKELLIGVTSFFRDPAAWEQLREKVIPDLIAGPSPGQACARGYPAAPPGRRPIPWPFCSRRPWSRSNGPRGILPCRSLPPTWTGMPLTRPARASFPTISAADVSPERLSRFFSKEEAATGWHKEIREMVIFAPQNLIMDPPFTKLDLLSCRNLLIYLAPEMQKKLFPLFHYSLNPGGILFLGSAETIGGFTDLFAPVVGKSRIFRRTSPPASGAGRVSLVVCRPVSTGWNRGRPRRRIPLSVSSPWPIS